MSLAELDFYQEDKKGTPTNLPVAALSFTVPPHPLLTLLDFPNASLTEKRTPSIFRFPTFPQSWSHRTERGIGWFVAL